MTTNTESSRSGQAQRQGDLVGSSFELKGSMLTMIELHILDPMLINFATDLKQKVSQAPDFFKRAPVAIDLAQVKSSTSDIDFAAVVAILKSNQLIPMGVRNGTQDQHNDAEKHGLFALLASSVRNSDSYQDTQTELQQKAQKQAASKVKECSASTNNGYRSVQPSYSKTIYQPVRSGQQVYAKGCDLVILSTVSAGADIISDGHIHVYGSLRGRALAGVNGDESARIFCHNLEAQLISIAGYYRVIEEIEESVRHQSVQIYLKDQRVTIEKM